MGQKLNLIDGSIILFEKQVHRTILFRMGKYDFIKGLRFVMLLSPKTLSKYIPNLKTKILRSKYYSLGIFKYPKASTLLSMLESSIQFTLPNIQFDLLKESYFKLGKSTC
jgi:hypothetical protein